MGNPTPPTLVVVPNQTRDEWTAALQLITGTQPLLVLANHRGIIGPSAQYVLTTYSVFSSNKRGASGVGNFPTALREVRWGRITLDKGHEMRNDKTIRYKNLMTLMADIKWVVTATPVHNSMADLESEARWLGIENARDKQEEIAALYMLRRTNEEIGQRNPRQRLPGLVIHDLLCPSPSGMRWSGRPTSASSQSTAPSAAVLVHWRPC